MSSTVSPSTGAPTSPSSAPLLFRDMDWVITLLILGVIGVLLVIAFEIYLIYKMAGKPFIRSMWLGQMLLFAIFLSYLVLFAFVPGPTDATCGITRFGVGFCYAMIYSIFLVKLMLLFSSKTLGYLQGIFQVLMFIFALGVQIAIDVEWLILKPPKAIMITSNGMEEWVCEHTFTSHITTLSYVMFLIVICTILGFKSIGIVTNHRESIFIAICSILSIFIFLAWILLGALIKDKSFEDPCLAFGLFIIATVVLFVMFVPKIRQLNQMKSNEFLEDDTAEYTPSIIPASITHGTLIKPSIPASNYKSNDIATPIVYVDDIDGELYSAPTENKLHHLHVETNPEALYLKHPGSLIQAHSLNAGSIRSVPVGYRHTKAASEIYATNPRVLKVSGDLSGRQQGVQKARSELNVPVVRAYPSGYGTARSVISTRSAKSTGSGTLKRARSLQDVGPL